MTAFFAGQCPYMEHGFMPRTTVSAISEYVSSDDTVTFQCESVRDEPRLVERGTFPLTLRFYSPTVFRFELRANGEVETPREYPEYVEERVSEPVDLDIREIDGTVVIDTGVLEVRVGLDPWSFAVEAAGETIYEAQPADIDVRGDRRVEPLWFDEEEINHGPERITDTGTAFRIDPEERIYGLGEQFTSLDRVGRSFDLWHVESLGTETEGAYKNVPFHLSTKGYGLLVDTACEVNYDLGQSSTASGTMSVADDALAFVFFYGPAFETVLERYTAFSGRPTRPPKWSFGVWMSRMGYESRSQLEEITTRLRDEEVPCDVVHLDPFWMRDSHSTDLVWDTEQFPDPEGMIADLHDRDFRVSLWEHPHVPVDTDAFATAAAEGYFVTDGTGKPYVMDRTCQGDYRGAIVDFTEPEAIEWWQDKHRALLDMGVDTFKTDYGEYVPDDAVLANGRSGAAMHNHYAYLYNEAVFDVVREAHGENAFLWSRSAWTGSQRYPVHWGGDPQTSFSGMIAALRGGLSASLSGFGFWSHDVGGFRGEPSSELYIRWAQFGLLSSHTRCHGTTPREPWAFGDRALEIFKRYARLRYRLIPYLYSHAERTARTGVPVVRPLVLEFQDDPRVHRLDTQFLLGDALLIAPVFYARRERDVYLPDGEWVEYWSDERYAGGRTVTIETPLDVMPIFLRAGHLVPFGEATQTVQEGTPAHLTLRAVAYRDDPTDATFPFYDEDADRVCDLAVRVDTGARGGKEDNGPRVDIDLDGAGVETGSVRVDGVLERPEAVSIDGETLVRAEHDLDRGQWTYDAVDERVRAAW